MGCSLTILSAKYDEPICSRRKLKGGLKRSMGSGKGKKDGYAKRATNFRTYTKIRNRQA